MPPYHSSTYPQSPPWSPDGPPYLNNAWCPMTPRRPCVPLPRCCDDHYPPQPSLHQSLVTMPSSPPRVHNALSAARTVVRYDLARDPSTIRMSSTAPHRSFPEHEPASSPSASVLNVRCERTGRVIPVHVRSGAVTCLDLLVQLHRFFKGEIPSREWRGVRGEQRDAMKDAYTRRTGHEYTSSARMKKVDYLCGRSTFKRIVPEDTDASASTPMWVLQTN